MRRIGNDFAKKRFQAVPRPERVELRLTTYERKQLEALARYYKLTLNNVLRNLINEDYVATLDKRTAAEEANG